MAMFILNHSHLSPTFHIVNWQ